MHPTSNLTRTLAAPVCLLLLFLGLLTARAESLEYLIEIQTNATITGTSGPLPQAQIVEVLQKRVQRMGGGEVMAEGQHRIRVRLFNLQDQDKQIARRTLERRGYLEFRLVHPESEDLLASGQVVPGYEVLQKNERRSDGHESLVRVLVNKRAERGLNGNYVASAVVSRGNLGEPEINFELNPEGAVLFAEVTRDNIGRRLAIVLDGELCSAPVIRTEINGGRGVISGNFELMEAVELANVLENPFGASLRILEEKAVDPSIEQTYRRKTWLKTMLLVGGALAIIGLVVGGFVYVLVRCLRSKAASSRQTPPVLPRLPGSS